MKRRMATLAALLLLISTPSLLPAQGRFPLKYEASRGDRDFVVMVSRRFVGPLEGKPGQLKGIPKDFVGGGTYFQVQLGQKDVLFALDGSKPPKLYVDTNRDGNLSDEKPFETAAVKSVPGAGAESTTLASVQQFIPVTVLGDKRGPEVRLSVMAFGPSALHIGPAGFMSGRVRLGGQDYQVAVADGNFDGRYDKPFAVPAATEAGDAGHETFAIDLNGDGKFDEGFEAGEVQPLPKMLRVKDVYYSVKVAADGSAIEVEKAQPPMGTLCVGCVGAELLLWSENGAHRLSGTEGTWQLPAGKYSTQMVRLNRTDEAGAKWTLTGVYGNSGKMGVLEVVAGQIVSIKMGPPLTAKTDVQVVPGEADVRLMILGQAGEEYGAAIMKGDEQQPAPAVRILSESGRVLETGSFEYG